MSEVRIRPGNSPNPDGTKHDNDAFQKLVQNTEMSQM